MTVTAERDDTLAARPPESPAAPERRGRRRRPRRAGLSIQSKLLIMLLAVSLLSSTVVAVIGFINGRDSLRMRRSSS